MEDGSYHHKGGFRHRLADAHKGEKTGGIAVLLLLTISYCVHSRCFSYAESVCAHIYILCACVTACVYDICFMWTHAAYLHRRDERDYLLPTVSIASAHAHLQVTFEYNVYSLQQAEVTFISLPICKRTAYLLPNTVLSGSRNRINGEREWEKERESCLGYDLRIHSLKYRAFCM